MSTPNSRDWRVSDVAMPLDRFPVVPPATLLKTALEEMGKKRLGIVCIVNEDNSLAGIFTDGDIRRQLLRIQKPFSAFFGDDVIDHAILQPATVQADASLLDAVKLMGDKQIWDIPVLDEAGKLTGLLHLHPVVQSLLDFQNR